MFKLTESADQVRTISEPVSVEGYETVPANATVLKSHRLWATYEAWLALGNTPEPYRTPEEQQQALKQSITQAVQRHLDETAQTRGYDGILSLCSYAGDPSMAFMYEAQAGIEWRSAVWNYCYTELARVEAGERTAPTADELVAELPNMEWPT